MDRLRVVFSLPASAGFFYGGGMGMGQHLVGQEPVIRAGDALLYGGVGAGVGISLTLQDWGVLIGIFVAVAGGIWGAYLKKKENRLKLKLIQAQIDESAERVKFMQQAGQSHMPYFYASPELKALEGHDDE